MESGDDLAARLSALRFGRRRDELAGWLRALLGPRADAVPVQELARAAALHTEYRACERASEGQDWALARATWALADIDEAIETLHRLSNNLGVRASWLIVPEREPQACLLMSDVVLDNPLGFALLAEHELALMDQSVPAGLSFLRHSHQNGDGAVEYEWELVVWGEPWLSATTRALRGIG
jgi:hypothetical protein